MELVTVTVVNRTSKPLEACWDGYRYTIPPGKSAYPLIVAEAAKRQNPLRGSENPYDQTVISLIGIEEQSDDCSPLEQSDAIERWDRKKIIGRIVEVIPGNGGLYASERNSSLPLDLSFVKP